MVAIAPAAGEGGQGWGCARAPRVLLRPPKQERGEVSSEERERGREREGARGECVCVCVCVRLALSVCLEESLRMLRSGVCA